MGMLVASVALFGAYAANAMPWQGANFTDQPLVSTLSTLISTPGESTPPNNPPETTISALPSDWASHDVTFSLTASDTDSPDGLSTYYGLNGPALTLYSAPVTIASEGTTTIKYRSIDAFDSAEDPKTASVQIDKTPPSTTDDHVSTYTSSALIHLSPTDALSGVASTSWTLDGHQGAGRSVSTSALGAHTLIYHSTDRAGNPESVHTVHFTVAALTMPAVKTSITKPSVSPSRPSHSKKATVTAHISPAAAARTLASTLYLYHQETKTVIKKVHGKKKRVKVTYWRPRGSFKMSATSSGTLSWTGKFLYTGKWQAQVSFAGSAAYKASISKAQTLNVK